MTLLQKSKSDSDRLAELTIRISTVLNRHLAEENCEHNIHKIVAEFFRIDTNDNCNKNNASGMQPDESTLPAPCQKGRLSNC